MQLQSDNTDAEYTGQGPIGSSTQSGGGGGFGGGVMGDCRSLGACRSREGGKLPSTSANNNNNNDNNNNYNNNNDNKESPYASVRSPAKEKLLYGGGELVSTTDDGTSPAQKCNMKRSTSVSSRCKWIIILAANI